ncbi:MAG: ABC transporter permease [Terriglobales bacterium]
MLRQAVRSLIKNPLLSLAAVLSLSLGIGANTTVFSFAYALFFQPPPVAHPERMVEVYIHDPQPGVALGGYLPFDYPDYVEYLPQIKTLSGLAIYNPADEVNFGYGGRFKGMVGELVSSNYFSVLGVKPQFGRGFVAAEGQSGGAGQVVVLSYKAWQERLGGVADPAGRTVEMNGLPFTVIGVAPRGFSGVLGGVPAEFWAPLINSARMGGGSITSRGGHNFFGFGRLMPGVSAEQAAAELDTIQRRLDIAHPKNDLKEFGATAVPMGMVPKPIRGFVGGGTSLLAVVTGLVLLIACVNAALVLLVEMLGRRREWAIRSALGASRGALIRQGLSESLLLALIAGGLGVGLARMLGPLLLRMSPPGFPIGMDMSLRGGVLLFALAMAAATGIAFGLVPAWQGARLELAGALKDGTAGAGRGAGGTKTRNTFVVAEVALCVVVLVGAALCLRSLQHARNIDPGFDTQHLITAVIDPGVLGFQGDAATTFMKQVQRAIEALPGVEATGFIDQAPLQVGESDTFVLTPGMQPPPNRPGIDIDTSNVTPGLITAFGTRMLAGRDFQEADLGSGHPREVVVNQTMAQEFWPHASALGKTLLFPGANDKRPALVIGVTATGKYRSLGEAPRPYFYQLTPPDGPMTLVARVAGPPRAFLPRVQQTLEGMDPDLTSDNLQTIQQYLAVPMFPARFTGTMLVGFGVLALLLAMLGLYGVIATSVAQRTQEFGIRMALGASGGMVARLVVAQGLRLALIGVAVGIGLALLLTRLMAGLLYGLSALDPVSFGVAAVLLAAVAALASYLPARRATRVDPLRALRVE